MYVLQALAHAALGLVTGEPFGGLTDRNKWWTDSYESIVERMRRSIHTDRSKFCIYCGCFIENKEIRDLHVKFDHAGAPSTEAEFCIYCGDHVPHEHRTDHYNTTHSAWRNR